MKIVYIAHPISGDIAGNVQKIGEIIRHINLTMPDVLPFAPYLADLAVMDDTIPAERERGIKNDREFFLRRMIDEVWVCSTTISAGVKAEIELALSLQIPVLMMGPLESISLAFSDLNLEQTESH